MSHANAELTPKARLRLARLIVDDGWTISTRRGDVHGVVADREEVVVTLSRARR